MKFCAAFVLLVVFQTARAWEYSDQDNWVNVDAQCGLCAQSPIDIDTSYATTDDDMEPMTFYKYGEAPGSAMTVTLNTHTVKVSWDDQGANTPTIRNGGLPGEYKAAQFHFHWGTDNTKGSEHTVDGHQYPAEVHIVHYLNTKTGIADALTDSNGLAVVGMFIEETAEDNADFTEMFTTVESFSQINANGDDQTASIAAFALEKLLPSSTKNFWRYKGSLTTPTCNEVVVWTVMKETIKMSANQLGKLRALMKTDGSGNAAYIGDTFRNTLPINYRPLTYRQAGVFNLGFKDIFRGLVGIGGVRN